MGKMSSSHLGQTVLALSDGDMATGYYMITRYIREVNYP